MLDASFVPVNHLVEKTNHENHLYLVATILVVYKKKIDQANFQILFCNCYPFTHQQKTSGWSFLRLPETLIWSTRSN